MIVLHVQPLPQRDLLLVMRHMRTFYRGLFFVGVLLFVAAMALAGLALNRPLADASQPPLFVTPPFAYLPSLGVALMAVAYVLRQRYRRRGAA